MELHFYILVQIRVQKYGEAGCDLFLGRGGLCTLMMSGSKGGTRQSIAMDISSCAHL